MYSATTKIFSPRNSQNLQTQRTEENNEYEIKNKCQSKVN